MFGELAVDHRIRTGRLVRLAALWLLLMHAGVAALRTFLDEMFGWQSTGLALLSRFFDSAFWAYHLPTLAFPYASDLIVPTGRASSMHVPCGPTFLLFFGPTFLMPLWLLILGHSLRRVNVRKLHLLRGIALAIPCAAMYAGVSTLAIVAPDLIRVHTGFRVPREVFGAIMLTCVGHHLYWWFVFIRRYLRVPHAAATVALFTVMNVLVLMISFTMFALLGWNL